MQVNAPPGRYICQGEKKYTLGVHCASSQAFSEKKNTSSLMAPPRDDTKKLFGKHHTPTPLTRGAEKKSQRKNPTPLACTQQQRRRIEAGQVLIMATVSMPAMSHRAVAVCVCGASF